jgi:hypothetical protein
MHVPWMMPLGGALRGTLPNPTLAAPAGSLVLVENHDFGSAATNYTFSGLDGNTDEVYLIAYKFIKAVVAGYRVDIQPNGVTTGQETRGAYNGTAGSGTLNSTTIMLATNGTANTNDTDTGMCWFSVKTGTVRSGRTDIAQAIAAGGIYEISFAFAWSDTGTNITSLGIVCNQASGIGAGSYVRLYKLKKT